MADGGPEKILAINLQGLGNLLLAVPALKALKAGSGRAPDIVVRGGSAAEFLLATGLAERVMVFGGRGQELLKLARECRSQKYDAALTVFPGGRAAHLLAAACGAKHSVGHETPGRMGRFAWMLKERIDPGLDKHDVQRNLRLASAVLGSEAKFVPCRQVDIPAGAVGRVEEYFRAYGLKDADGWIGMHPGSDPRFADKRWPEKSFAELADMIGEQLGLGSIILDGPADGGSGRRIARMSSAEVHALEGRLDVLDTAALMLRCKAVVSNDSGLMHLACVMGLPVVAVFGPSDPVRAAPFSAVGSSVISQMECAPCHDLQGNAVCPHGKPVCLESIDAGEVFRALSAVLAGRN